MQMVIDIPDIEYDVLNQIGENTIPLGILLNLRDYIRVGTPLPEGHGRLIDAEDVKNNHEKWLGYLDEDMIARLNIAVDNHVKTIIEADKAESEDEQ